MGYRAWSVAVAAMGVLVLAGLAEAASWPNNSQRFLLIASVSADDQDDHTIYVVVVNVEDQYSIWPDGRDIPAGWREAGMRGTKSECLKYIEEVWTNMRPKRLRDAMNGQAKVPREAPADVDQAPSEEAPPPPPPPPPPGDEDSGVSSADESDDSESYEEEADDSESWEDEADDSESYEDEGDDSESYEDEGHASVKP